MKKLLLLVLPVIAGLILFVSVFWIYYSGKVRDRGDSRYVLHVAESIIKRGDSDLDEYKWLIEKEGIYKSRNLERNGHIYSIYPMGTILMSVPFVAVYDWYATNFVNPKGLDKHVVLNGTDALDNFLAAIFTASAIVTIYAIGLTLGPWYIAGLGSIVIALGTSAWTSAARTLWPHGPAMFVTALGMYLIIQAKKRPIFALLALPPLTFGFIIRPTGLLPLVVLTIFIFIKYRKLWLYSILLILLTLLPYFWYNYTIFGNILSPFYYPGGISMKPHIHQFEFSLEGLAGQLISPNRGLFIFSPVLILSIVSIIWLIISRKISLFEVLLTISLVIHWVLISFYHSWWAGYVFGPRYFTDVLPIFGYFILVFLVRLKAWSNWVGKLLLTVSFISLSLISGWIHYRGATYIATSYWNSFPQDVDYVHERIWDWQDLQFLRR